MQTALLIAAGYLLGSIPFGILFTRARGIDLRAVGSGSIGATNVLRAAGAVPAVMTLLCDLLKGTAVVAAAMLTGAGPVVQGAAALAVIAGHNFSIFLRFKGGKGVATSVGVILIYAPLAGILTVIVWLLTLLLSRYSSLGALVSFGLLPVLVLVTGQPLSKAAFAAAITTLLIIRHRDNIRRLLRGEERRVGEKA